MKGNSDFNKFSDKQRINEIFEAFDDQQKDRFETFRQSNFDEKKMKKVLSQILGNSGKMPKTISAVIKSVSKIYLGQLVEECKLIQIEELRETLSENEIANVELGPIEPH